MPEQVEQQAPCHVKVYPSWCFGPIDDHHDMTAGRTNVVLVLEPWDSYLHFRMSRFQEIYQELGHTRDARFEPSIFRAGTNLIVWKRSGMFGTSGRQQNMPIGHRGHVAFGSEQKPPTSDLLRRCRLGASGRDKQALWQEIGSLELRLGCLHHDNIPGTLLLLFHGKNGTLEHRDTAQ